MERDDATAKFQQALPYALLPISPSLAALHSVRVQSSEACHQCGSALHRGESSVRTVRTSSNDISRAIQHTCLVCGWVKTLPVARGNAALFPRTRKRDALSRSAVVHGTTIARGKEPPTKMQKVKEVSKQSTMQVNPPAMQANPPPPAALQSGLSTTTPKSRAKKKVGLQSMLERNKEKEYKEKQSGSSAGGGLAMFLNNL